MARKLWVVLAVLSSVAPASAGPLRLDVAVEWFQRPAGGSFAALVGLELPLERWAAPPRTAYAEGPPVESAPLPVEVAPPVTARPAPLLGPRFVRGVVAAALDAARTASAEARLDALSARARAASVLPELALRAARSTDQSLRLAPSDAQTLEVTQTGGADLLLEARASWRLDRLVFADEELRVEALRTERAQRRDRLVARVLERLFVWQRARAKLAVVPLEPDVRLALELERVEAELELDVLTAGYFAEARARLRGPTAVPPR